jgi:D-arabinose 5-phosphate isomerase GutQ
VGDQDEIGVFSTARELVRAEAAALVALEAQLDERLVKVAQLILERHGKVLPVGVGTSGHVARRMAHLLSVTGTPAIFLHPADGLHGSLGAIQPEDVVIAISRGGQSSEINEFSRRAKKLGAAIVVLTADPDSELGELADVTVALSTPSGADPRGIIAMGSTLVTSAWGDALAITLMEMRGYGWDAVLYSHPGGAVGKLASALELRVESEV